MLKIKTVYVMVFFGLMFAALPAQSALLRPFVASLKDEVGREQWRAYFRSLNRDEVAVEFQKMLILFTTLDQTNVKDLVSSLQKLRPDMPIQLRWLLAAVEIENGLVTRETVEDTKSALVKTQISHSMKGGLESNLYYNRESSFYFSDPNFRIPLRSETDIVYLNRLWQLLPSIVPGPLSFSVENARVRWMGAISEMTSGFSLSAIHLILEDFKRKGMTDFSSPQLTDGFTENAVSLMRSINWKYLKHTPVGHEIQLLPEESRREGYLKVKGDIQDLVNLNLRVLILRYSWVRSIGLTGPEIFNRTVTASDVPILEGILKRQKLDWDSYLIAASLWNKSEQSAAKEVPMQRQFVSYLASAKLYRDAIEMPMDGQGYRYVHPEVFVSTLKTFYETFTDKKSLDKETARNLLQSSLPKVPSVSISQWDDLEWLRLQTVAHALDQKEMESILEKWVTGVTPRPLADRLRAAKFLRLGLEVPDLDRIVTDLKKSEQRNYSRGSKGVVPDTWNKNEGQLVELMVALQPRDQELADFLNAVYVDNQVEGHIGAQTALAYLERVGAAVPDVKQELLRRLNYVGQGDSSGNLRAFARLFPEEGSSIVRVIYNHRSAYDKVVPMLTVLVDEIERNPKLLESISTGIRNIPDKNISNALYGDLPLDSWLEGQIRNRTLKRTVLCPKELTELQRMTVGNL